MIGPTNAGYGSATMLDKYAVKFDQSTFSSGANLSYSDGFSGLTPLNNSSTTGTMNSSMAWGSWQTLETNPYLKDCYYSVTYGDGTEVKLNPYDLTKALDGTDMSSVITAENVMFNIPTRYILRNANGFTHSRNPASGNALAHTIDGDTYNWLAIGVYPSVNVSSVAKSVSGVKPSASITRPNFRTYSRANGSPSNGIWMQWNFHQYQLMRDLVLASTLNWDSQTRIGRGNLSGGNNSNWVLNGFANTLGLFVGSQSTGAGYGVKSLIENMWGQCWQFVDDTYTGDEYADSGSIWKDIYAGQNATPTDDTTNKTVVGRLYLGPSTGNISAGWKYASAINVTNAGWGIPLAHGGSTSSYTFDGCYNAAVTVSGGVPTVTSAHNFLVGGHSNRASSAGVSALAVNDTLTYSGWSLGSRLAFVHN